jgi:phosphoribosylpyrophosphate synthetase
LICQFAALAHLEGGNLRPPSGFQERFYFGDTVLPLFESGIPLVKQTLLTLPDADNITIAYPDEGAWKRFHSQLGEYPEVCSMSVTQLWQQVQTNSTHCNEVWCILHPLMAPGLGLRLKLKTQFWKPAWRGGQNSMVVQVICTKVRDGDKRIVRLKEGEAKGRHVIIVDDLVQSGSTLLECGKLLKAQVPPPLLCQNYAQISWLRKENIASNLTSKLSGVIDNKGLQW